MSRGWRLLPFGVAVAAVLLATVLRWILDPFIGERHPFTFFFGAVAVAAWYGGLWPALLATLLSYLAADWFFISPRFEINWPHNNLDEAIALLSFLFPSLAITITSYLLHRTLDIARKRQRELEYEVRERKNAEQALERSHEQLREQAGLLEERVKERTAHLHEAINSLTGVCYHLAHDLRAPLRAMEGFATMLSEEVPDSARYADQIGGAAQRMDLLLRGLMEYGRLGHENFALSQLEIEPVMRRALQQISGEITRTRAEVSLGEQWPSVVGNEELLLIVFLNLLSNALKFVAPSRRPQVRLRAEQLKGRVRVWVEDNGVGFPPEFAHKAFGIFERLHPRQDYAGTGIGLAIVEKAIQRMKGRLGVESQVDQGSRFWFELSSVPQVTVEKSSSDTPEKIPLTQASLSE